MAWNPTRHPLDPEPAKPRLPPEVWERLPVWREKWAEIWYVPIGGAHYVYRSPTHQEIIEHDQNVPVSFGLAADALVKRCLLYPEKLPDSMPFSSMAALYEMIWSTSGFANPEAFEEELEAYDQAVRMPEQLNLAVILRAFPGLLPDEVNSWQHEKLIYHLALARLLLGIEPEANQKKRRPKLQIQSGPTAPPAGSPPKPASKSFDWMKDKAEIDNFMSRS